MVGKLSQERALPLDRDRFTSVWKNASSAFDGKHCSQVFDQLSNFYQSKNRHYHSSNHIIQCLLKLDEVEPTSGSQPEVELAVWFHDVIYTAGDPMNESNSVVWFQQQASSYLHQETIDSVSSIIAATEHRHPPRSSLEQLMVDVDLSSFGMPEDRFMHDGRNIRKEFINTSDDDFVTGQLRFLHDLLNRNSIFYTSYFQEHYEKAAQQNITRLISMYNDGFRP